MKRRNVAVIGALFAIAISAGACDAILGGDFKLVDQLDAGQPATGGGGGAVGGSGGSAASGGSGGSGGQVVKPPFLCSWQLDEHQVVAKLDQESGVARGWDDGVLGVALSHSVRVVARHKGVDSIDVFTIHSNGESETTSFAGWGVHDVKRVDNGRVAALVEMPATGSGGGEPLPQLALRVFKDSDGSGSAATTVELTTPAAFADLEAGESLKALFSPVGNGDAQYVGDIAFWVHYEDINFRYRGKYGFFTGSALEPVLVSPDTVDVSVAETRAAAILHRDDTTYVMTGDPEGGDFNSHEYILQPPVTEPVAPRTLPDSLPIDMVAVGDETNIGFGRILTQPTNKIDWLFGKISTDQFGSFTLDDLPVAATYDDFGALPVVLGEATYLKWHYDTFILCGRAKEDPTTLAFMFFDVAGQYRGHINLPFNASVGGDVTRKIDSTMYAIEASLFDSVGGRVHVVWIEEHDDPNEVEGPYQVLYYDRLECSVDSGG